MMMDKIIGKAPLARIMVNTPFYQGDIQALCLPDSIYDLISENIPLDRPADKLDPVWTVSSCKAQKEDNWKEDNRKKDNRKKDNRKEDNRKEDNRKEDNRKEVNRKDDNWKENNKKQDVMKVDHNTD